MNKTPEKQIMEPQHLFTAAFVMMVLAALFCAFGFYLWGHKDKSMFDATMKVVKEVEKKSNETAATLASNIGTIGKANVRIQELESIVGDYKAMIAVITKQIDDQEFRVDSLDNDRVLVLEKRFDNAHNHLAEVADQVDMYQYQLGETNKKLESIRERYHHLREKLNKADAKAVRKPFTGAVPIELYFNDKAPASPHLPKGTKEKMSQIKTQLDGLSK
jgi:septal ring factor EnvC (AmiA/AmiB activator)